MKQPMVRYIYISVFVPFGTEDLDQHNLNSEVIELLLHVKCCRSLISHCSKYLTFVTLCVRVFFKALKKEYCLSRPKGTLAVHVHMISLCNIPMALRLPCSNVKDISPFKFPLRSSHFCFLSESVHWHQHHNHTKMHTTLVYIIYT